MVTMDIDFDYNTIIYTRKVMTIVDVVVNIGGFYSFSFLVFQILVRSFDSKLFQFKFLTRSTKLKKPKALPGDPFESPLKDDQVKQILELSKLDRIKPQCCDQCCYVCLPSCCLFCKNRSLNRHLRKNNKRIASSLDLVKLLRSRAKL